MHWAVSREGAKSGDEVLVHTYAWGDRKRRFSPRQIHLTFDVLVKKGWVPHASHLGHA